MLRGLRGVRRPRGNRRRRGARHWNLRKVCHFNIPWLLWGGAGHKGRRACLGKAHWLRLEIPSRQRCPGTPTAWTRGWLPIAGSMYDILVPTRNMKHMVTGEPQHMLAVREFRDTDAARAGITMIVHRFRGIQGGLAARHWRRKGSGHSSCCCCCPGSHCFCRLCFSGTPRGESRHHEINHGIHIGRNDGARIVAWSRVRTLGRWSTGNERV